MRRTLAFTLVVVAFAALSGCASTPADPPPLATEAESEAPAPTEDSAPVVESLSLVDCETLLPIDRARSLYGELTEFLGERPVTEFTGWVELPAITTGLADAPQARLCTWGVPNSDGTFTLHVAEVTAQTRTEIEAALPGAGYSSVISGTVTAYEAEGNDEVSTIAATQLFTGPLWIMSNANSLATTGAVAASALDALRVANPTLGL